LDFDLVLKKLIGLFPVKNASEKQTFFTHGKCIHALLPCLCACIIVSIPKGLVIVKSGTGL